MGQCEIGAAKLADRTDKSPGASERHVLLGSPEALVEINDDGSVAVTLDQVTYLTVERLGEIVAFVEQHGQVTVVQSDD
jgi:hypothetical protein